MVCPFELVGMDFAGLINPRALKGNRHYISIAINYATKFILVRLTKEEKLSNVITKTSIKKWSPIFRFPKVHSPR